MSNDPNNPIEPHPIPPVDRAGWRPPSPTEPPTPGAVFDAVVDRDSESLRLIAENTGEIARGLAILVRLLRDTMITGATAQNEKGESFPMPLGMVIAETLRLVMQTRAQPNRIVRPR